MRIYFYRLRKTSNLEKIKSYWEIQSWQSDLRNLQFIFEKKILHERFSKIKAIFSSFFSDWIQRSFSQIWKACQLENIANWVGKSMKWIWSTPNSDEKKSNSLIFRKSIFPWRNQKFIKIEPVYFGTFFKEKLNFLLFTKNLNFLILQKDKKMPFHVKDFTEREQHHIMNIIEISSPKSMTLSHFVFQKILNEWISFGRFCIT